MARGRKLQNKLKRRIEAWEETPGELIRPGHKMVRHGGNKSKLLIKPGSQNGTK